MVFCPTNKYKIGGRSENIILYKYISEDDDKPRQLWTRDNQPYVMCNKIIQIIISCPQPLCGFLLSHSSFNKHNLNKI